MFGDEQALSSLIWAMGYNARNDEIRDNVTRMRQEWEAEGVMRGPTFRFIAATWLLCSVAAASAAEIKISDHPIYNIILEGTIVPGDYDKLRRLIDENCPSRSWIMSCPSDIYLASPGGSVTEAMKIGRLVRTLRLGTQVPIDNADLRQSNLRALKLQDPENYLCASACFFIAVAGIERSSELLKPILGVHRPFMTDADLKTISANQAIVSATQVRTVVEAYLKEMNVPSKYADLMFSIPKGEVRWISQADFDADFAGLIPELQDWMNARCDKRTDVDKRVQDALEAKFRNGTLTADERELRGALFKKFLEPQVKCELAWKDKLREDAWKAYRGL
jgi:hypothetical protein